MMLNLCEIVLCVAMLALHLCPLPPEPMEHWKCFLQLMAKN